MGTGKKSTESYDNTKLSLAPYAKRLAGYIKAMLPRDGGLVDIEKLYNKLTLSRRYAKGVGMPISRTLFIHAYRLLHVRIEEGQIGWSKGHLPKGDEDYD